MPKPRREGYLLTKSLGDALPFSFPCELFIMGSLPAIARFAIPPAFWCACRVFGIIGVSARAMCFNCVASARSHAAHKVLTLSHRFKMIRANAARVAAQVVDHHANRDRAIGDGVRVPMGTPESVGAVALAAGDKCTVTQRHFGPDPLPASFALINTNPEAHGIIHTGILLGTY